MHMRWVNHVRIILVCTWRKVSTEWALFIEWIQWPPCEMGLLYQQGTLNRTVNLMFRTMFSNKATCRCPKRQWGNMGKPCCGQEDLDILRPSTDEAFFFQTFSDISKQTKNHPAFTAFWGIWFWIFYNPKQSERDALANFTLKAVWNDRWNHRQTL